MNDLRNLLFFIVMLGGLIFIHELGHFLVALRCGVKVKEFGVGLPPRALKLGEWRGTTFTLNWIPLGGFVRPAGEFDPAVPAGLAASSRRVRLAVLAAGPIANFLIGYLLFTFGFIAGWPDRIQIVDVLPCSPAEAAGLHDGDLILRANGADIRGPGEWIDLAFANLGKPIALEVQRGEQTLRATIVPNTGWSTDDRPTGVYMTQAIVRYPLLDAGRRAAEQVAFQVSETLALPVRLLNHQVQPGEVRFSSPVGLKQVSDRVMENAVASQESFPVWHLAAMVSIGLGLANLLPLPALDGGRIAFVLIEAVRGKPIEARLEKVVHVAGMLALLGLMAVLVVQDLINPLF